MSKKQGEKNAENKAGAGGPVARESNPERYGNGGASANGAASEQPEAGSDQAARDGATDSGMGTAPASSDGADGAQSGTGETGGANPGTAAPQDVVQETEGRHPAVAERDPIIDRDPGDEAFLREHAAGAAQERTVDESPEFNQDRDAAIEGLHDGPGGRKYLVLNLSDDAAALDAAKAYGMAIRGDESKAELANQLLRIAGVNVGRL